MAPTMAQISVRPVESTSKSSTKPLPQKMANYSASWHSKPSPTTILKASTPITMRLWVAKFSANNLN